MLNIRTRSNKTHGYKSIANMGVITVTDTQRGVLRITQLLRAIRRLYQSTKP